MAGTRGPTGEKHHRGNPNGRLTFLGSLYYWRPTPAGGIQSHTTAFLCQAGTAQDAIDANKRSVGHDDLIAAGWTEGVHACRCVSEEFEVRRLSDPPFEPPPHVVVHPVVGVLVFLATVANVMLWLIFR